MLTRPRRRALPWRAPGAARLACVVVVLALPPALAAETASPRPGAAADAQLTGREIMEKARSVNLPKDEAMEVEMQLIPDGGRPVRRKLHIEYLKGADGLDRTLLRFSYPRRMKGTGLLTVESVGRADDQWLYLPSFRRVRRIAADAKTERFVQSDFTYEDLQPEDLDDNTYTRLRTDTVDDRPCHLVEAVPKSPSGYARRLIAVDAERWVPARTVYLGADGRRLKTQVAKGFRQHEGRFWRPDRVEMTDHERGHATVLLFLSRAINQAIPPDHFTERYLRSGF